jgi:iron transport multicopper oxidase
MKLSTLLSSLFCFTNAVSAATLTYDWEITWVEVNPDNRLTRPAVGINNQWPCPSISGNIGDTVVVTVHNGLGNETASLHFHGLHQVGNNAQDGPPMVNQCPILPGQCYTYTFTVRFLVLYHLFKQPMLI